MTVWKLKLIGEVTHFHIEIDGITHTTPNEKVQAHKTQLEASFRTPDNPYCHDQFRHETDQNVLQTLAHQSHLWISKTQLQPYSPFKTLNLPAK